MHRVSPDPEIDPAKERRSAQGVWETGGSAVRGTRGVNQHAHKNSSEAVKPRLSVPSVPENCFRLTVPKPDPHRNLTQRAGGRFFAPQSIARIPSGRLPTIPSPCPQRGALVHRMPTRVLSEPHSPNQLWAGGMRQVLRRGCRGSGSQLESSFDVLLPQAPSVSMRPRDLSRGSDEVPAKTNLINSTSMRSEERTNRSIIGKGDESGDFSKVSQDSCNQFGREMDAVPLHPFDQWGYMVDKSKLAASDKYPEGASDGKLQFEGFFPGDFSPGDPGFGTQIKRFPLSKAARRSQTLGDQVVLN